MKRLVVIVPSRGRPQNIARLARAFQQPGTEAELVVVVDTDDAELEAYRTVMKPFVHIKHPVPISALCPRFTLVEKERKRMVPTLNAEALVWANGDPDCNIGFMGDDHCPRRICWDTAVCDALAEPGVGIVYGNDLLQRETLPTAVFMRSSIVRALGYMAPPGLLHLYADTAWKMWGDRVGCLRYLPDVVIEHLHFLNGKAPSDERYAEVNSSEMWDHDRVAWDLYCRNDLETDVAKMKEAMANA